MIIYKTTNLINDKIYVGKDATNDPKYLGSGFILRRAIERYGKNNFKKETIEECNSLEELSQRELFWIDNLNSTNKKIGYNIAKGGLGGDTFSNQSKKRKKEILEKITFSLGKIRNNKKYRKKLSEATKKQWQNPKHREMMVQKMTGRKIKWKRKIASSIREWHKVNHLTENGRQRMRDAAKKRKGKELKHLSDDVKKQIIELYQFIGPKQIERQLGISRYLIVRFLKNERIYQKGQKGTVKSNK
jgi:group I intron endonuclease